MKKLVMGTVMVVMMSMTAQAQGDAISKFFNKYQDDESFTLVNVSSKMFNLFTNMDVKDAEDKELLDAISKVKGLRVLAKKEGRNARELYKEALSMVPAGSYEELLSVRDKDKDMKFFIKESKPGIINELVMVMGGNEEFMVLSLFGEIDLKQISRIGSKMNIDGLQHLNKMNKDGGEKDKTKENSKDNSKKSNEE